MQVFPVSRNCLDVKGGTYRGAGTAFGRIVDGECVELVYADEVISNPALNSGNGKVFYDSDGESVDVTGMFFGVAGSYEFVVLDGFVNWLKENFRPDDTVADVVFYLDGE